MAAPGQDQPIVPDEFRSALAPRASDWMVTWRVAIAPMIELLRRGKTRSPRQQLRAASVKWRFAIEPYLSITKDTHECRGDNTTTMLAET